jgi:hypothetical protein
VRYRAGPAYYLELSTTGVLRTAANATLTVWNGPQPSVTAQLGATYWAFTAPNGGLFVVYGTSWADRGARIVVQCVPSTWNRCTVVPPTFDAATYDAIAATVYGRARETGVI